MSTREKSSQAPTAFEFSVAPTERVDLLDEARRMVSGLPAELGDEASRDAAAEAASRLLDQLNSDVAEFSAYPDVIRLERDHFTARGLSVPVQFEELTKQHSFYWVQFPITLSAPARLPFSKLECAIEFNPGDDNGHLRPRARMILPDRKFKTQIEASGSVDVHIGENFQFEAGIPPLAVDLPVGHGKIQADVDAKIASQAGVVVGPFTYRLRAEEVTHSPAGTEKVLWRLTGSAFVRENDPLFVVVMQLPKEVDSVQIAAAMQAYHGFSLADAGLTGLIGYFTKKLATFFRKGAPVADEQVWDVTPSL